jgi:hypothetical protein
VHTYVIWTCCKETYKVIGFTDRLSCCFLINYLHDAWFLEMDIASF